MGDTHRSAQRTFLRKEVDAAISQSKADNPILFLNGHTDFSRQVIRLVKARVSRRKHIRQQIRQFPRVSKDIGKG